MPRCPRCGSSDVGRLHRRRGILQRLRHSCSSTPITVGSVIGASLSFGSCRNGRTFTFMPMPFGAPRVSKPRACRSAQCHSPSPNSSCGHCDGRLSLGRSERNGCAGP